MSQRFEISWVTYSTQRPEFANQSNYLYLERYSTAPNWHAVINGASVARNVTTVAGAFNQVNLAAFSNWHTSNSCNLYVNNITNDMIKDEGDGIFSFTEGSDIVKFKKDGNTFTYVP